MTYYKSISVFYGTVARLGLETHGFDCQFIGYAMISNNIYSWSVDWVGHKNAMIVVMKEQKILRQFIIEETLKHQVYQ